ncbi:TetR/AcrR family transcriptional regulator [Phenylobacterium sp.]|uniref:TetR/AcrR family transcriptional regulator n=1 Tax=Phenylobacterium sp. TaxID=1871053 RepID=UPI00286B43DD|nr:TetR/AcrR family transcriptional regulator [Phenylobacterium sp.]
MSRKPAPAAEPKPKQIRKSPEVRSAEILAAAGRAFIRDGYAAFTLRGVAADVGIRLSTLQHHFPSREILLAATLADVLGGWGVRLRAVALDRTIPVPERMKRVLQVNLDLTLEHDTGPVLWELFALSQREEFARRFAQASYLDFRRVFTRMMAEVRPDLSERQLMAHATLIVAQTEGLTVFMRPDDPAGLPVAAVREALDLFVDGFMHVLMAQAPAPA